MFFIFPELTVWFLKSKLSSRLFLSRPHVLSYSDSLSEQIKLIFENVSYLYMIFFDWVSIDLDSNELFNVPAIKFLAVFIFLLFKKTS